MTKPSTPALRRAKAARNTKPTQSTLKFVNLQTKEQKKRSNNQGEIDEAKDHPESLNPGPRSNVQAPTRMQEENTTDTETVARPPQGADQQAQRPNHTIRYEWDMLPKRKPKPTEDMEDDSDENDKKPAAVPSPGSQQDDSSRDQRRSQSSRDSDSSSASSSSDSMHIDNDPSDEEMPADAASQTTDATDNPTDSDGFTRVTRITPQKDRPKDPYRPYYGQNTRVDMKIKVPPGRGLVAIENLRASIIEAITILFQVSSPLVIYPYLDDDHLTGRGENRRKPITRPDQVPTQIQDIRIYFPGFFFAPNGGDRRSPVHLGHRGDSSILLQNSSSLLASMDHGIWPRSLQVEHVHCIGWALFSFFGCNTSAIQRAIKEHTDIDVGLRWKPIWGDKKDGPIPNDKKVFALHFEVDRRHYKEYRRRLQAAFSGPHNQRPLKLGFTIIPEYDDVDNSESIALCLKAKEIQARWAHRTQGCRSIPVYGATNMDAKIKGVNKSLRTIIHDIKARDVPQGDPIPLFFAVNKRNAQTDWEVIVHPRYYSEAQRRIKGLLPYMVSNWHQHRKAIRTCFSQDTVKAAKGAIWNAETQEVLTETDKSTQLSINRVLEQETYLLFDLPDELRDPEPDHDDIPNAVEGTSIGTIKTTRTNKRARIAADPSGPPTASTAPTMEDQTHSDHRTVGSDHRTVASDVLTMQSEVSRMQDQLTEVTTAMATVQTTMREEITTAVQTAMQQNADNVQNNMQGQMTTLQTSVEWLIQEMKASKTTQTTATPNTPTQRQGGAPDGSTTP